MNSQQMKQFQQSQQQQHAAASAQQNQFYQQQMLAQALAQHGGLPGMPNGAGPGGLNLPPGMGLPGLPGMPNMPGQQQPGGNNNNPLNFLLNDQMKQFNSLMQQQGKNGQMPPGMYISWKNQV